MDFVGFGRSDKFSQSKVNIPFQMHCDTLSDFIKSLSLNQVTLVVQDWGGLIGLQIVSEMPELFSRLVIGEYMAANR